MTGTAWVVLIAGILVLIIPWVTTGSTLQWIETILGLIVGIVGVLMLKQK